MSIHQKSTLPVHVKQEKTIATVNKRYMLYLVTTMIMLWGAATLSSLEFL